MSEISFITKDNSDALVNALEAVLFAAGEPVSRDRLRDVFSLSLSDIDILANLLKKRLQSSESGIEFVKADSSYALYTKSAYKDYVTKYLEIKRTSPISRAALEALAVIAYKQPVTRSYVEQVRGVDCSGIINTLSERGLIEERGRLEAPGRPILYGTSLDFLKSFGIESLSELPKIDISKNPSTGIPLQMDVSDSKSTAEP